MKIQELSIIFVILILPISIVLSTYTQLQIQTVNIQALYDTKLTTATYDAIKAFQLNTANSTLSSISNSKLRDIEASVNTFKNSMMSTFKLNGYTEDDMNNYIPALVYTMYDGFYIYSPYENYNNLYEYEYETDARGNSTIKKDASGKPIYKTDASGNKIPLNNNGETMYGLKPYIAYSCRYIKGNVDVVITYSLDNYITVQGKIGSAYVNKSGYLIDGIVDGIDSYGNPKVTYNGVNIESEVLSEYVDGVLYPYVKENGTKYYYDSASNNVFYISNGMKAVQADFAINRILNNNSAMKYYIEAKEFTEWLRNDTILDELTYADAYDVINVKVGDAWQQQLTQLFPGQTNKIFSASINIENDMSNFNRHRIDIIRHKIESNLAVAISNYNHYSSATGIEFQMPKLTDEEWELAINNVCLISFVQGLDIGGKIYNGYTVVNNTETKEVIQEENIFVLGQDNYYHRIGATYLEDTNMIGNTPSGIPQKSAGRLNLDFKRKNVLLADNSTKYYYPLKNFYGSYNSIITQNEVTTYEDIYAYVQEQKDDGNVNLAKAFYTALGRERYGLYKASREIISDNVLVVGYSGGSSNFEGVLQNMARNLSQNGISATYIHSKDANALGKYIKAQKENYKLIIINTFVWNLPLTADELKEVNESTNLITIANDANQYTLPSEMIASVKPFSTITNVQHNLTTSGINKLGDDYEIIPQSDSSQVAIKFRNNVDVLCTAKYSGDSEEYDAIGIWKNGNYKWVHSQLSFSYTSSGEMEILKKLVNYAMYDW